MRKNRKRNRQPVSSQLHPVVYKSIAGLILWLVLAAWAFFDDSGYTGYLLAVVTGFFSVFISLPALLWLTSRRHDPGASNRQPAIREWASRSFAIWQGQLTGRQAAIQVLLPIAALAVAMTSIGIVYAIVAMESAS